MKVRVLFLAVVCAIAPWPRGMVILTRASNHTRRRVETGGRRHSRT
jgi:hypothetical protein